MVEIPEHLLKRSKERRSAMGLGGGDDTPQSSESATAPEQAAAASPAPAAKAPPPEPKAPEPPPPDPLYIQAAKERPRLPWWSIPVFAALPLWGWVFVNSLYPAEAEVDITASGEGLYASSCAGCHGADGAGSGAIPGLDNVHEDFPDFRDQMMWVRVGSDNWPQDTYGANDVAVDGGMPSFDSLSDEELAQVVLFERQQFSDVEEIDPAGADEIEGLTTPEGDPLTEQHLLQVAEGELTFADVGLGELSADAGLEEADL